MSHAAQNLFLEHIQPQKNARILALEGSDGRLTCQLARFIPDGRVLSLARDIREVWAAQTRLADIPLADATLDVFPKSTGWDIVLLTIPKGRRYARTLLLAAWRVLKPGGQLLLSGPTKGGANAVIKDAERLFGNASILGYRSHQRIAACIRGESLVNPLPKEFQQPGVAPSTQHFVQIDQHQGSIKLETHPGIFSWEALDEGTALLLDHMEVEPGSRVWDVGCGYGAIGFSAVLSGAVFVAMSDINLIAIDYAHKNAIANGLDHKVAVFAANTLTPAPFTPDLTLRYDLILSNPAFHQGRNVDKSMADQLIQQAPDFLMPSGRLLVVANRFLNYGKFMQKHFNRVSRIAETTKFHLLEGRNQ